MGGLSLINNIEIRCINCFHIYTMKIKPEFPNSKLQKTCKCSSTSIELSTFLIEYKKHKKFAISCSKCNKTNQKDYIYCEDCQKLNCLNCLKSTHQNNELKNHKYISIDKYDFYCTHHKNDNFCAYCKTCKFNICLKCIQQNLHEKHKISIYKKMYDEKKMKEYLKKAIKSAEDKINYNKIICNMISKKINKNDITKLKALSEINENENKNILETLNIFNEIYDAIKNKNHALISNMIDNMDFNLERIKFEQKTTKEKDKESLINYFQTDFILKIKIKKEDNIINNETKIDKTKDESNEENKEEIKKENEGLKEEKKEGTENNIHEKNEQEKKDEEEKEEGKKKEEKQNEEKKEEEKKEEEKKEEDKKDEEEKDEEKKKEEKQNEEKKEEENIKDKKEEEIKGDDGHVKSIKEIKELLNNKISSQGGFRQSYQISQSSNQKNDIISEPKGNPENTITIIQNQKINKTVKKKPKKKVINLD